MHVTTDYLAAWLTGLQTQFTNKWNDVATNEVLLGSAKRVPSTSMIEDVPISGALSGGPQDTTHGVVIFEDWKQYHATVQNAVWQDGFEIQREVFTFDKQKMYADKPIELVARGKAHIANLLGDLRETNGLAWDGIAMYANSRALGTTLQVNDNLLTATGTYTTPANIFTDIATGQQAAMAFTNDQGVAMGIRLNTIELPTALYDTFYAGMMYNVFGGTVPAAALAPSGDSFKAGAYTVVLNRRLTDAGDWYMHYVDPATNAWPYMWTDVEVPHMDGTTSTDSYEWKSLRKAQYTTYGIYQAAYGNPIYSVKFA
jgi:hypothetical protein